MRILLIIVVERALGLRYGGETESIVTSLEFVHKSDSLSENILSRVETIRMQNSEKVLSVCHSILPE